MTIRWMGKEYHYLSRHFTLEKAKETANWWRKGKNQWSTHIVERVTNFNYGSSHMWSTQKMYYLYGRRKS